jgi:branched-chain amino acid transport system permease protein
MNTGPARVGAALLIALGVLPFFIPHGFWLTSALLVLLSTVLGQSWNILGGYGGQYSFGHALFFGVGAFATAALQVRFGVNAWIAAPLAVGLGALAGMGEGWLVFRYGLRGSYFALVTLAFAELARILVAALPFTGGGFGLLVPLHKGGANFQFADARIPYLILWAVVVLGVLVAMGLERTRFGARLVAVRENEEAARALGIHSVRVKTAATALSAALAAAAGVLYLQIFLFIDAANGFGSSISVQALLAPIVGGVGTAFGPLFGALMLRALGEATHRLAGSRPGVDLVLYGMLLIVMLRFVPGGLARLRRRAPGGRRA